MAARLPWRASGRGSVFTFTIPSDAARSREQPVVLVIEDEPSGRELMASYLEPLGIHIEFAATAEQGLAMAHRIGPDAITLDLQVARPQRMAGSRRSARDSGVGPGAHFRGLRTGQGPAAFRRGATEICRSRWEKKHFCAHCVATRPTVSAGLNKIHSDPNDTSAP